MLNRTVSLSLKMHQLPDDTARLLATWLIPHLDVDGAFYADAAVVKSMIFPRRTDISMQQIEIYINVMAEIGLIRLYDHDGQRWMIWPGFRANQPGMRTEREDAQYPTPHDATLPATCRQSADNLPSTCRQPATKTSAEHEAEGEAEADHEEKVSEDESASNSNFNPSLLEQLFEDNISTAQARRFEHLHDKHPEHFTAAVQWAADRGMTPGEALQALKSALPRWQLRPPGERTGKRWYTDEEYDRFFVKPAKEDHGRHN
jgi:hypothetical protein